MYEATTISPVMEDLISTIAQNYDVRVYSNYSGRGMYGATCFGLVFSGTPGQLFSAFLQNIELFNQDWDIEQQLADLFDAMEIDTLGWDKIYYFPGWTLEEDFTADYEDEDEE